MQTLRLIWARHGEADRFSPLGDMERSLSTRGQQQALSLAQQLCTQRWLPQHIFCSSACRTFDTAQIVLQHLPTPCPLVSEPSLYLGNLASVQRLLALHDLSSHHTLLLVGHNPGWSMAAQQLSGSLVSLDTAEAALLSIQADDWNNAVQTTSTWTLHTVLHPM